MGDFVPDHSPQMMKCGHSANATQTMTGKPICAICAGIKPGWDEVDESPPTLEGRKARCTYYGAKCRSETDSNTKLAFFEYQPDQELDRYYCGCYGWD